MISNSRCMHNGALCSVEHATVYESIVITEHTKLYTCYNNKHAKL